MEMVNIRPSYNLFSQPKKKATRGRRVFKTTLESSSEGVEIFPDNDKTAENLEKLRKRTTEAMEEIRKSCDWLDHKLQFSVNKDIDRVIVKIVDVSTNEVIKEIPTKEVQKMQSRIREALGVFFDETV